MSSDLTMMLIIMFDDDVDDDGWLLLGRRPLLHYHCDHDDDYRYGFCRC